MPKPACRLSLLVQAGRGSGAQGASGPKRNRREEEEEEEEEGAWVPRVHEVSGLLVPPASGCGTAVRCSPELSLSDGEKGAMLSPAEQGKDYFGQDSMSTFFFTSPHKLGAHQWGHLLPLQTLMVLLDTDSKQWPPSKGEGCGWSCPRESKQLSWGWSSFKREKKKKRKALFAAFV